MDVWFEIEAEGETVATNEDKGKGDDEGLIELIELTETNGYEGEDEGNDNGTNGGKGKMAVWLEAWTETEEEETVKTKDEAETTIQVAQYNSETESENETGKIVANNRGNDEDNMDMFTPAEAERIMSDVLAAERWALTRNNVATQTYNTPTLADINLAITGTNRKFELAEEKNRHTEAMKQHQLGEWQRLMDTNKQHNELRAENVATITQIAKEKIMVAAREEEVYKREIRLKQDRQKLCEDRRELGEKQIKWQLEYEAEKEELRQQRECLEIYTEERGLKIESSEERVTMETREEQATQIELVVRPVVYTEEVAPVLAFPIPLPGNLGHDIGARTSGGTDERYIAGPYIEGGAGAIGRAARPKGVGKGVAGGRKLKMT